MPLVSWGCHISACTNSRKKRAPDRSCRVPEDGARTDPRTCAAERTLDATAAARRLTKRPRAILSAADVGPLTDELRRIMAASFPGLPASALARSGDTIRWHALGARCREARGPRNIRDVSVALTTSPIPTARDRTGATAGDPRRPRPECTFGSSVSTRGWHAGVGRRHERPDDSDDGRPQRSLSLWQRP